MKLRLFYELKKLFIILSLGIVYYISFSFFNISVPCIFNKTTGLLCPACGITRMIAELLNFNFKEAFSYNKLLFILLPIIVIVFVYEEIRYIKTGSRTQKKLSTIILWVICALLILFGIIRNIV